MKQITYFIEFSSPGDQEDDHEFLTQVLLQIVESEVFIVNISALIY